VKANFKVERQSLEDGVEAVSVFGELDQATAPALRNALDEAFDGGDNSLFIDLAQCDFIDSTGLSLVVETQRRLAERQRRFALCSPRPEVTRLLELTGIDEAVGLCATRDEAIALLGGARTRD